MDLALNALQTDAWKAVVVLPADLRDTLGAIFRCLEVNLPSP